MVTTEVEDSANGKQAADQPRMKSNSIVSEDFETAIKKAGFGKFNYFILLIAIPASSTSPFVTGTLSFVIPVAGPDLGLTAMSKALLQSAPYAGMILSAFIWGALSDAFGRKYLIVAGFLIDFIMNTLSALIPNWITIFIFKFLSGLMVNGPYSIFVAYLSEVFTDKKRDIAVLSIGIFSSALQCFHVGLAYLVIPSESPDWLPLKSWQLFIFYCGIPSLITGISCAFCVESPKFLTEKGKSEKALNVCKKIYTINTGLSPDTYPVKKIKKPIDFPRRREKVSVLSKIMATTNALRAPYINRLSMIFTIQISSVVTVNLLRLWLPEMLTVVANADPEIANTTNTLCPLLVSGHQVQASTSQVTSRESVYYTMVILQGCNCVSQLIFAVVVKYVGKKSMIVVAGGIGMGCVISIPYIDSEYIFIPSAIATSVMNVVFFAVLGLIVEIFPTSIRATSVSTTMMVGRIGVLTANFLVANLMYAYCENIFYILGMLSFCVLVVCSFLNTTPIQAPTEEQAKNQT